MLYIIKKMYFQNWMRFKIVLKILSKKYTIESFE